MERLLLTIPTAVVVFAATNVDDLIVLTFLFMATRAGGRLQPWQVVAGQAAGVAVLIGSAAVAAVGLFVVPVRWVGLLGLVPLAIGLWRLVAAMRRAPDAQTPTSVTAGLSGVAGIAIVNGADNVTVYAPLFRYLDAGEVLMTIAVFMGMIGVWCAAAAWLGSRMARIAALRRLSRGLVPIVLIAIGAFLLSRSIIS